MCNMKYHIREVSCFLLDEHVLLVVFVPAVALLYLLFEVL